MSGYESAIIITVFGCFVISRLPWAAHQIGDALAEFHAARLRGEEILTRRLALQKLRGTRTPSNNGAAYKHEPRQFDSVTPAKES